MMENVENQPAAKRSFKTIVDKNCRALILGTMPGEESLRQQQYYAYTRNLFWHLIFRIFDAAIETEYIKNNNLYWVKIALWDVYEIWKGKKAWTEYHAQRS